MSAFQDALARQQQANKPAAPKEASPDSKRQFEFEVLPISGSFRMTLLQR